MKIFAEKLRQRHLRARRRYWQSMYTQNGFRRVPLPCLETYNEEGQIVPFPPFPCVKTPLFNLLPRMAPSTEIVNWSEIAALMSGAKEQV